MLGWMDEGRKEGSGIQGILGARLWRRKGKNLNASYLPKSLSLPPNCVSWSECWDGKERRKQCGREKRGLAIVSYL